MKKYIAYAIDGYTQDSKFEDTDNCQMLGFYHAESIEEAYKQCYEQLIEWRQSFEDINLIEVIGEVYRKEGTLYDERLEESENEDFD